MGSNSKLTLQFFGRLTILQNEQPLEIKSQKAVAALAFLVLQRRRQSRDHLAALLWPEADQARARANLRRALWTLNQTPLSTALSVADDSVALLPNELAVDVFEFEHEADRRRGTEPRCAHGTRLRDAGDPPGGAHRAARCGVAGGHRSPAGHLDAVWRQRQIELGQGAVKIGA